MSQASTAGYTRILTDAQAHKLGEQDKVRAFLQQRFSKSEASSIMSAHMNEEQRPIETLWDAVTGITAYAKSIDFQDRRVDIEREAGKVLQLAA